MEELLAIRRQSVLDARKQQVGALATDVRLVADSAANRTFLAPLRPQCIPEINATAASLLTLASISKPGEFLNRFKVWEDSCGDGVDNDCDGLVDREDPDCGFMPVSQTKELLAWTPGEPLPNAAAAAMVAMSYTKSQGGRLGVAKTGHLQCWALGQVQYMLGSSGRSYMVGFGRQSPAKIQHMASACPAQGTCTWSNSYYSAAPNPQMSLVEGALVAGPDSRDRYSDDRSSSGAAVGVHYNAAFVGAVAGLLDAGTSSKSCMKLYAVYPNAG